MGKRHPEFPGWKWYRSETCPSNTSSLPHTQILSITQWPHSHHQLPSPHGRVTTDLLDIPVLVAVVCLLCTVLRDNLPVSDIKAKQRSRTKPDFLHAVIFKVLEEGGFVWTMEGHPNSFLNVNSKNNFLYMFVKMQPRHEWRRPDSLDPAKQSPHTS